MPVKNQAQDHGEVVSKTSLAPQGQVKLAPREEVPDYLKGLTAGQGLEEMGREDMTLPRVAIAQELSPALKKNKPNYIPDLQLGQMYNTLTRKVYGSSLIFVPVLFTKMRIFFEEMSKGGGILCQSFNSIDGGKLCPAGCSQCEHSRFTEDAAPDCDLFMNYASLLPEHGAESVVVSMKSASLKIAKQLNGLMRIANLPAYAKAYRLTVVPDRKGDNDFYNFAIQPAGFAPQEIVSFGQELYSQLKAQGIKMDLTDLAEEREGDASFNTPGM